MLCMTTGWQTCGMRSMPYLVLTGKTPSDDPWVFDNGTTGSFTSKETLKDKDSLVFSFAFGEDNPDEVTYRRVPKS